MGVSGSASHGKESERRHRLKPRTPYIPLEKPRPHTSEPFLVVQYLGVLKVNLWDSKGKLLTQKG